MTGTAYEHPTLAQFLTHAEKFGTECVYDTAEKYLSGFELLQLDKELTRIDTERRKRYGTVPRRKRMERERQIRLIEFLAVEGVPNSRIATHLGITTRNVERARQQGRRSDGETTETVISAQDGESPSDDERAG